MVVLVGGLGRCLRGAERLQGDRAVSPLRGRDASAWHKSRVFRSVADSRWVACAGGREQEFFETPLGEAGGTLPCRCNHTFS